ncbi:unnamed protein product [Adineta steineri]|uniref:MATH domain-containing protein n=2 Tax=Adineta steineri TaxID=433720 RepID=A0A816BD87_9BILA|nr:unnamed protein product [Adineta steineri]
MEEIDPRFICGSCKLVLCEPYQLTFGHHLCKSCIHTDNNCAICLEVIETDKIGSDRGLENDMRRFSKTCSQCDWRGPLTFYKKHIEQNHGGSNDRFIWNGQVNGNDFSQNSLNSERLTGSYAGNRQLSNDGSFIWRITDVERKRIYAVSERQMSIDSEPFYSSPTGYKLCLRLYLNGDGNARGTHLSLFLVIMRNEFDAIIHWPFKYKIIFTLLNQLQSNSPSKSFWLDVNLTSFHSPTADMNIACGIPKFFRLDIFEQTYDEYVQNDTMFIKVEVDFTSERSELASVPGVNELANNEKHVDIIHEDIDPMSH